MAKTKVPGKHRVLSMTCLFFLTPKSSPRQCLHRIYSHNSLRGLMALQPHGAHLATPAQDRGGLEAVPAGQHLAGLPNWPRLCGGLWDVVLAANPLLLPPSIPSTRNFSLSQFLDNGLTSIPHTFFYDGFSPSTHGMRVGFLQHLPGSALSHISN